MMNGRDFFIAVARMRRAQRGLRDSSVFRREARELEKQVDAEIERTMRPASLLLREPITPSFCTSFP